jgi:hypothetical protein
MFKRVDGALRQREVARDALAGQIKGELQAAAFDDTPIVGTSAQISSCEGLIMSARQLAAGSWPASRLPAGWAGAAGVSDVTGRPAAVRSSTPRYAIGSRP